MKNKIFFLIIIASSILFSCQKVIDVELDEASSQYVIEGTINNLSDPCQVRITKTKKFSDNNNFEKVSNALVTVSDDIGNFDTLNYTDQGVYQNDSILGVPGRTYYLTIKIDSKTFTSSSQMPYPVNMDSLYCENVLWFGDTTKLVQVNYEDPMGIKNNYRFEFNVNQEIKEGVFFNDDEYTDGKLSTSPILYFPEDEDKQLKPGDFASVEMQCIDKNVYHYFFTLDQTITQSAAAPTNPIGNITGGALGYFSAYTSQKKSIIIP